jgi:hypothetical protein
MLAGCEDFLLLILLFLLLVPFSVAALPGFAALRTVLPLRWDRGPSPIFRLFVGPRCTPNWKVRCTSRQECLLYSGSSGDVLTRYPLRNGKRIERLPFCPRLNSWQGLSGSARRGVPRRPEQAQPFQRQERFHGINFWHFGGYQLRIAARGDNRQGLGAERQPQLP